MPFRPRNFDKVPAEVKDARGYHVAQRLNLAAIVARTDKGVELPRSSGGGARYGVYVPPFAKMVWPVT